MDDANTAAQNPVPAPAQPPQEPAPQPTTPAVPDQSGGGIPAQNVPPPAPPPVPSNPPTEYSSETFVVPPAGSDATVSPATPANGSPGGGGSIVRKLLMVIVALLFLGGFAGGGWFLYSRLSGPKAVTLTYWGLWENDALIAPLIAEYQTSHPNVTIQYVRQNHRQYRERLQAAVARGDGPDVFRFHNTWVAMLKNELSPVPADIMTAADFKTTFYPTATRDLVAGETIFGIPLMIDGLGLYYNEDLFASAGVSPPTTYEELLSIVPRLTVKGEEEGEILTAGIALGTTNNVEHFSDIVATMMMQNGASLVSLDGDEAEQTLVFYRKFSDPEDPLYTWNSTLDNSVVAFANGRVAMIYAPSWRAFDIKQLNPNLRFKIAPVPQLPGNTVTWASYWVEGVSVQSQHQGEAWEFLQFLTSRETATALYTEASKLRLFGEPYARVAMGSGLENDPFVGAYIVQAPDARSFPLASNTFDNGLNDRLIQYFQDAINATLEGDSPSGALSTASQGFRQVLSSYGLSTGTSP